MSEAACHVHIKFGVPSNKLVRSTSSAMRGAPGPFSCHAGHVCIDGLEAKLRVHGEVSHQSTIDDSLRVLFSLKWRRLRLLTCGVLLDLGIGPVSKDPSSACACTTPYPQSFRG